MLSVPREIEAVSSVPMIVSHQHRFVYVQVPQTGSTAVGAWMVEHLGGIDMLRKHTTLPQGRRILKDEIDGYYVVASVRDPLDQLVSSYFKVLTGPSPATVETSRLRATYSDRVRWATSEDATLDAYIDRFIRRPHTPVWTLSLRAADHVIRYENLQEDAARVPEVLGVDGLPPVPHRNKTNRDREPIEQLASADRLRKVARLQRPFRHEFGYTDEAPTRWDHLRFEALIRVKELERRRLDSMLRHRHEDSSVMSG